MTIILCLFKSLYLYSIHYIFLSMIVLIHRECLTCKKYSMSPTIHSFRYRDNSVHFYECSLFWLGIFITFDKEKSLAVVIGMKTPELPRRTDKSRTLKKNETCLLFYVDMRILIDKALTYFYML